MTRIKSKLKGKNILLFTWLDLKNPDAGGVDIRCYELFRRFVKQGNKVTFLSSGFKNAKRHDSLDGINIIRQGGKYTFALASVFHYLLKLRKEKYDVIIEDMNKVPLFTPLYVNKPVLAYYSHLNARAFFKELFFPLAAVAFFMEQVLMPLIYRKERFVAVSPSTSFELQQLGIKSENIFFVPDGLNPGAYKPIPFKNKKPNQLLVLDRLKRYKGIHHAIRAMKIIVEEMPDTKMYIAGRGDYEKKLKKMTKRLGLDKNIIFLGYVSDKKKIKLLQESSLLIHSSFKEGRGINVIEANACGTPAVASNVAGLRDSVLHMKTGFLAPYGDANALGKVVLGLLKNDDLRRRLGENAIINARKHDWNLSYKKLVSCIRQLMKNEN